MKVPAPHFHLYSQAQVPAATGAGDSFCGQWRFVLESADGANRLEAADQERASSERLELLALVRGLEALDQPSKVTLVTSSRYVSRGIRFGLTQWRDNGWHWERFGEMSPIKDHDLWQRVDQALQFHEVECKSSRVESSDDLAAPTVRIVPHRPPDELDAAPIPVRRAHRGKSLRFDGGEQPRRSRRPAAKAVHSWPTKALHWLASLMQQSTK